MSGNSKINHQIEAMLKVHPKNYGKVFYVNAGEAFYGNDIKFKAIVEYAMNPKRRLNTKRTMKIESGKSKGDLVKGQDYRSETKISDFIRDVYKVNTCSPLDVAGFVRKNLIELGIDPITVDKDYLRYVLELGGVTL